MIEYGECQSLGQHSRYSTGRAAGEKLPSPISPNMKMGFSMFDLPSFRYVHQEY